MPGPGRIQFLVAALAAAACSRPAPPPLSARPIGRPVVVKVPLGLPPLPVPPDNPPTAETIALGEKLFASHLLSLDGAISCATCHDPRSGFAGASRFSAGVGGRKGLRNAPTVRNAAYNALQFWDGRAPTLESQASGPLLNPVEMAHTIRGIERACSQDPALRVLFEAAYGPAAPGRSPVTMERITRAIASYERTLLRANSPFDRFRYGHDNSALSAAATRGLDVFSEPAKGNCAACHIIGADSSLFTDNKFHNLGAGMSAEGELTDLGRFLITHREGDQGAFRTPSLRNVAGTAPYMHDGSLKTLKQVIDFYIGGGNANPYRDPLIKPLTHLTRRERDDLVAFLESLTGESAP